MAADLHIHVTDNADVRNDETPSIWIGEVSWLKAALFRDNDSFIPQTVQRIQELINRVPVIDDALIAAVEEAFGLKNNTIKADGVWDGSGYELANVADVIAFLEEHKGKYAFGISW